MKLLYITRKYPPMVGGMENLSFALAKEFSNKVDTTLVTWGKSQRYLPIVLPYFLIKALYLIPVKKVNHIHIGDALLSPIGILLKTIFRIKTTITVVGLDVTFNFPGYQFVIPKLVSRFDKVICISNATLEECVKRGIPKEKCVVIPCGIYPEEFRISSTRDDLEKIVGRELSDKKIMITVGRLVERKGVYWFIKNVFPKLPNNIVYLIIGEGSEREKIFQLINKMKLKDRIFLLGKVSNEQLKAIYNSADVFVMPNIKVPGTIEGFGIVAIEASSTGLPVIASDIEGIRAAILDGKNGILVESKNPDEWTNKIRMYFQRSQLARQHVRAWTVKNYSWSVLGTEYIKEFQK